MIRIITPFRQPEIACLSYFSDSSLVSATATVTAIAMVFGLPLLQAIVSNARLSFTTTSLELL
jgi:hypothetical protein